MSKPGWTIGSKWVDVDGGVREVYSISGPPPFGGLTCADREQAIDAVQVLNFLTDRVPPEDATDEEPPPDPTAQALADAMDGLHVSVSVRGSTITVTEEP